MLIYNNTTYLKDHLLQKMPTTENKKEADILLINDEPFDIKEFPNITSIYSCCNQEIEIDDDIKNKILIKYPSEKILKINQFDIKRQKISYDFRDFCIDHYYYRFNLNEQIKFYIILQDGNVDRLYKMCIDEYEHLKNEIKDYKNIVDLGCGMGRSSIFFNNLMDFENSTFYLCDFNENTYRPNGENKGALGYHKNSKPVPFNSLELTDTFCNDNNLTDNKTLIDLNTDDIMNLNDIDLIYSFYSVGYHWSISEVLKKYNLLDITSKNAKFIFGVRQKKSGTITHRTRYLKLDKIISGNMIQDFAIYSKK